MLRTLRAALRRHVADGSLKIHASRPTLHGLETHLALVHRLVRTFDPHVVVVDPISNLDAVGSAVEVQTIPTTHHKSPRIIVVSLPHVRVVRSLAGSAGPCATRPAHRRSARR